MNTSRQIRRRSRQPSAAGKISTQPASGQGVTTLTITDYVKPGDKLILGFDPVAKKLRSYQVQSYVEKPKDDAGDIGGDVCEPCRRNELSAADGAGRCGKEDKREDRQTPDTRKRSDVRLLK